MGNLRNNFLLTTDNEQAKADAAQHPSQSQVHLQEEDLLPQTVPLHVVGQVINWGVQAECTEMRGQLIIFH